MKSLKCVTFAGCCVCLYINSIANAQIFPPDAVVEDKKLSEWVAEIHNWEWWYIDQGLSDAEARNVPPSGLAAANNDGPVHFRAGYFGPFDGLPIVDNFLVPAGRPILQRALNFTWHATPQDLDTTTPQDLDANGLPSAITGEPTVGLGQPDPDTLLAELMSHNNDFRPLYWEIDGEVYTPAQIDAHRVSFQFTGPIGSNPFDVPPGDWLQAVDGFWFMLEPLAPGEQLSIRVGGIAPDGTLVPDITNTFTAVPEPTSLGPALIGACLLPLVRRRNVKYERRHCQPKP